LKQKSRESLCKLAFVWSVGSAVPPACGIGESHREAGALALLVAKRHGAARRRLGVRADSAARRRCNRWRRCLGRPGDRQARGFPEVERHQVGRVARCALLLLLLEAAEQGLLLAVCNHGASLPAAALPLLVPRFFEWRLPVYRANFGCDVWQIAEFSLRISVSNFYEKFCISEIVISKPTLKHKLLIINFTWNPKIECFVMKLTTFNSNRIIFRQFAENYIQFTCFHKITYDVFSVF